MQTSFTPTPAHPRSCMFFAVYDDIASGKRAKETCDFIRRQFGWECRIHGDFWKLDVLRDPVLLGLATPHAREADIIIFSTSTGRNLPPEIRTWLQECLSHETDRPRALMSVSGRVSNPFPGAVSIERHLRQIAARSASEFLSRTVPPETDGCPCSNSKETPDVTAHDRP